MATDIPYAIRQNCNIFSIIVILLIFTFFSINNTKASTLEYFKLSIDEAMKMYAVMDEIRRDNNFKATGTMTDSQLNRIIRHAQNSLNYSNKVKNKDLDKLDRSIVFKDLKDKYEDLFRNGMKGTIQCYKSFDQSVCKKSDKLLKKWGNFYRDFRKKFY